MSHRQLMAAVHLPVGRRARRRPASRPPVRAGLPAIWTKACTDEPSAWTSREILARTVPTDRSGHRRRAPAPRLFTFERSLSSGAQAEVRRNPGLRKPPRRGCVRVECLVGASPARSSRGGRTSYVADGKLFRSSPCRRQGPRPGSPSRPRRPAHQQYECADTGRR